MGPKVTVEMAQNHSLNVFPFITGLQDYRQFTPSLDALQPGNSDVVTVHAAPVGNGNRETESLLDSLTPFYAGIIQTGITHFQPGTW